MPKLTLQKFDYDFKALSRLINAAWTNEHTFFPDYEPDYLSYLYSSPDTIQDLKIGIFEDEKLVSFILNKRKHVKINGHTKKLLFQTIAATDPGCSHMFPYLQLKEYCINWAEENQFAGTIGYLASGINNNGIEELFAKRKGFSFQTIGTFNSYILHYYDNAIAVPDCDDEFKCRNFQKEDVDLVNMAKAERFNVLELLENETIEFISRTRQYRYIKVASYKNHSYCVSYRVNNYRYNNQSKKVLVFDWFISRDDDYGYLKEIVSGILKMYHRSNLNLAIVLDSGGYDLLPIRDLGFRLSPSNQHQTRLCMTSFFEEYQELQDGAGFCMEVM